jgi:molybdate transport system ATP-binding protein
MTFTLSVSLARRDLDVDLTVAEGDTLALVGPNGAGKSTVLSLAAGLSRPDRGTITLDGRLLTDGISTCVPPHARRVALLAQDALLFPHLSVRDNVAFGPRALGASRQNARATADSWLGSIGLSHLAERRPTSLSGGQAQRVAVARALAARPRLLLLDEPLAALDVEVTPALRYALRDLLRTQTTIITTHDALDALVLADRVAVIQAGHIVESGPTAEVLTRPRSTFAASLVGLNMVTGTWVGTHLETPSGERVSGTIDTDRDHLSRHHPATATFRPAAVTIIRGDDTVVGFNCFDGTVTAMEPCGELIRVRTGRLSADVTPQVVTQLGITPGLPVRLSVNEADVAVYPSP